jgi:hypothetical protein
MKKNVLDIESMNLDIVEAEFINIRQSTIKAVEGGHVELQQVGSLSIEGERVEVTQGAAVIMKGDNLSLNQCAGLVAIGGITNLDFSCAPVSVSIDVANVNKSAVGILAARNITSNNSTSLLMVGQNINGNVTTLIDWRSALAISAVAGGIFGLFSLFRRR